MAGTAPSVAIFSATGASGAVISTDPSTGIPMITLPVISAAPTTGQCAVGDDAVIKSHDAVAGPITSVSGQTEVWDANTSQQIDTINAPQVRTYQAQANPNGVGYIWAESFMRVLVAHTGTAPANGSTPVGWMEACTPNGNTIGRVPIYQ